MQCFAAVLLLLLLLTGSYGFTQTTEPIATSDAQAISLAQKSIAALLGRATITDVTLNASVISILGSDNETETGTFRAKSAIKARVDVKSSKENRSDVRTSSGGLPAGAWKTNSEPAKAYVQHNCWTDAVWFFPALSSLSQTANSRVIFSSVGQEEHDGVAVRHIRVNQLPPPDARHSSIFSLSAMDFYLDPNSFLPLAIDFNLHADDNETANIPVEVRFANYQLVSGVQVPFHFQRLMNGSLMLDVTVTSARFNTGLQDTVFTLQ